MTIQEELSTLREATKQFVDHPRWGKYEDSFLYSLWKKKRAEVIIGKVNAANQQLFCIELETSLIHDCDCVPYGCKVLKSKNKLPHTISMRYSEELRVMTLSHKLIGYSEPSEVYSDSLDPIKKNKRRYTILNNYLVIFRDLDLKAAMVSGPWEDPLEWLDIQLCSDSLPDVPECKDLNTIDAGLTEEQSSKVLEACINQMFVTLQIPVDERSDIHTEK